MIWQYIIVGSIVGTATVYSTIRLVKFFSNPLSKCDGCSSGNACSLEELKREIAAKK